MQILYSEFKTRFKIKMVQSFHIEIIDFLVELNNDDCDQVLKELEHIDDEAEELDIMLLKINDVKYARKYGINKVPAIVYFRRKFPSIFRGNVMEGQYPYGSHLRISHEDTYLYV